MEPLMEVLQTLYLTHKKLIDKENVTSYVYVPKKRNVKNIIYPKSIFFKFNLLLKFL